MKTTKYIKFSNILSLLLKSHILLEKHCSHTIERKKVLRLVHVVKGPTTPDQQQLALVRRPDQTIDFHAKIDP
jgi:hypothetical protein